MNRTALSVIALAVGSVLIIGLFNIYKPQTKRLAQKVFHKPQVALEHTSTTPKGTPVTNQVDYMFRGKVVGWADGYPGYTGAYKAKGKFGEKYNHTWGDFNTNHMPFNWGISGDGSQNFTFGDNGSVQHVNIVPNATTDYINFVDSNNHVVGTHKFYKFDYGAYVNSSKDAKSAFKQNDVHETITNHSSGLPSGYHVVNGNGQANNGLTYNTNYGYPDYVAHVAK